MARSVLFILGVGSIGWGLLSFFAGSYLPDWMGLSGAEHGELYIESLAINAGLWPALGIFALFGAAFQRLRLAATLAFVVSAAGLVGGRVLAIANGAEPGVYTGIALAAEVAMLLAASGGYVSEKTRLARETREKKKAERAALEAALEKEHAEAAAITAQVVPEQAD
ncbi:MAG: hypothetical protein WBG86_16095 [Polyangiales bacterium]